MTSKNFYIITRLVSGEQVMASLLAEDENFILLKNPMIVRNIPNVEQQRDVVIASPLCIFADPEDTEYPLDKKNVLYIKKLHQSFVKQYEELVEEFNSETKAEDEELSWGVEEEVAFESVKKKIDLLHALLNPTEEKESEIDPRMVFTGNNTIN